MKRATLTLLVLVVGGIGIVKADYTITGLGTLGGDQLVVNGMNNSGQVVGYAYDPINGEQAFLYSNGTPTTIGSSSIAWGINNSGQVVGSSNGTAFLYSNGAMTNLGTLGGSSSIAYGINSSGQVAGVAWTPANVALDAFIYSGGNMLDLGFGMVGGFGTKMSINDSGQIVGGGIGSANGDAFIYSNGVLTNLGTLGGFWTSAATGINNSGVVVGYDQANGGYAQSFLYSNGTFINLTALGGLYSSTAAAINNSGQVVGSTYNPVTGTGGFLYSNGTTPSLDSLLPAGSGWSHLFGTAINDNGQIAGEGIYNGVEEAFIMTPVIATPAPASLTLLVIGASVISGYHWRRRKLAVVNCITS